MIVNYEIGKSYKLIMRHECADTFREVFKQEHGVDHVSDDDPGASELTKSCFGFIFGDSLGWHPLYFGVRYFIMTEGGRTFENLTQLKCMAPGHRDSTEVK